MAKDINDFCKRRNYKIEATASGRFIEIKIEDSARPVPQNFADAFPEVYDAIVAYERNR